MPKQEIEPQSSALAQGLGAGGRPRNRLSWRLPQTARHWAPALGRCRRGPAARPLPNSGCTDPLQGWGLPSYQRELFNVTWTV